MSTRFKIKKFAACRANANAMTAVLNQHLCIDLGISFGRGDRKCVHRILQMTEVIVITIDGFFSGSFYEAPFHCANFL